jgi:hypothetical protein
MSHRKTDLGILLLKKSAKVVLASTTLADLFTPLLRVDPVRQYGHRRGIDRMMRSTMAWRTAGNVG